MKKITCISCVILNEVKNLNTSTNAFQILRFAQDDTTKLMQLIFYTLLKSSSKLGFLLAYSVSLVATPQKVLTLVAKSPSKLGFLLAYSYLCPPK